MKRINHEEAYSLDGACTNWAEEFFSRMRRAEIGHHHHIAGAYLLRTRKRRHGVKITAAFEWRSDAASGRIGDEPEAISRFHRLLATSPAKRSIGLPKIGDLPMSKMSYPLWKQLSEPQKLENVFERCVELEKIVQ